MSSGHAHQRPVADDEQLFVGQSILDEDNLIFLDERVRRRVRVSMDYFAGVIARHGDIEREEIVPVVAVPTGSRVPEHGQRENEPEQTHRHGQNVKGTL